MEVQRRGLIQDVCGTGNIRTWSAERLFFSSCQIRFKKDSNCSTITRGVLSPAMGPSEQINANRVWGHGVSSGNDQFIHIRNTHDDGAAVTSVLQPRGFIEKHVPETDSGHLLFFSDTSSQCNDDQQGTPSFVQPFHSIEELNNHLLTSWWEPIDKPEHVGIETSPHDDHGDRLLADSPVVSSGSETEDAEELFVDDDGIIVFRLPGNLQDSDGGTLKSRFRVSIPKQIMRIMPPPPDGFVTPESVDVFNIEVQMVDLCELHHVDVCIDWLLQDNPSIVALVCKYGTGGCLSLIQLSVHQRCVLIRVPSKLVVPFIPMGLRGILSEKDLIKVGADIQKDALAIFHFLGVAANNCARVSQYLCGQKRKKNLLSLFRELFQWDWSEKKKIICSDWGSKDASLEQVKYAALDAWTSRLVWVGQTEMWKVEMPSFSLAQLPWTLLDYFGRSIFSFESRNRKDDGTAVEVKGASVEVHRGFLSLKQKNFRSRVMGYKSTVELRFKDGRKPQKYVTLYREGSRVILDNAEASSNVKRGEELEADIAMVSKVLVDNSNNSDVLKQKLEDSLYVLLCIPGACPRHILVALGCLQNESMTIPPRQFSLEEIAVQNCKVGLNPGQSDAWQHMLSTPLSAVIGPPGTGKTTVISAVAKAWTKLAAVGETLVCAAHQNVAVRHMAETMIKEKIPGVLLLVSEDYYVGWHEDEYAQVVKEATVISGSQSAAGMQSWTTHHGNQPPKILLCTLALIGTETFHACLMGGKVSYMIIDECSQAAEGSLIPVLGGLPHLQMLSVVGDPCQLPPFGLRPSVFDLLSKSCTVKLLQDQYRMPYRVAQFVSTEFYGGILRTDACKRWEDSESALLWVDVRGTVDVDSGGTSLCNAEEAEAVVEWCRVWRRDGREVGKGKLVVLTLYEAQRSLISALLGEESMDEEVIVYNADSFQGQEAEVALISLVVGDRMSAFAADRRRACVLLSRARRELLVFGSLAAVAAARRRSRQWFGGSNDYHHDDNIWMSLASYCQRHGWVVPQLKVHPPPSADKMARRA